MTINGFIPTTTLLTRQQLKQQPFITNYQSSQLSSSDNNTPAPIVTEDSLHSHYYQLEELEDKETSTTELYLNSDNTITLGPTDGPLFSSFRGTWGLNDDGSYIMTIIRSYTTGMSTTTSILATKENDDDDDDRRRYLDDTSMGTFDYDVERYYRGEMTVVGACTSVTGVLISMDDVVGEREVGFFNMIDTTDEKRRDDEGSAASAGAGGVMSS